MVPDVLLDRPNDVLPGLTNRQLADMLASGEIVLIYDGEEEVGFTLPPEEQEE
jgi:hypothetical protein